jgi:hypothetical protein
VVRLPARVGWSATTRGVPTLIKWPGLPVATLVGGAAPAVCLPTDGGAPRDGAQASAGVTHEPGAAQAFAEKLRLCTANGPPPVECRAKMARKHVWVRQSSPPREVVRTAARSTYTEADPFAPTVTTVLFRLSQASCSDEEGSGSNTTTFGSHSATAYVVP